MAALSSSLVISKTPAFPFSSVEQSVCPTKLSFSSKGARKSSTQRRSLTVQAGYSDGRRSSGAGIFVGGFVLGGLVVGAIGCVYAPQITKALTGPEKKELMKKLPKFIYDEEKEMEKKRKEMLEKIEQINSALDNLSFAPEEGDPNGAVASPGNKRAHT